MRKSEKVMKGILDKYEIDLNTFNLLLEDDYPLIQKKIKEILEKMDLIDSRLNESYNTKIKPVREEINSIRRNSKVFKGCSVEGEIAKIDNQLIDMKQDNIKMVMKSFKELNKLHRVTRKYLNSCIKFVMEGVEDYES